MKIIIVTGLVCLMALLQNCNNASGDHTAKAADDHDSILVQWRADSLGCSGLRTTGKASMLFKKYNFQTRTADEIIKVLGKPNKVIDNGSGVYLQYYIGTRCENGVIIDSIEHCWANFFYIKKGIRDCSLSTACE